MLPRRTIYLVPINGALLLSVGLRSARRGYGAV